jgi:D-serine deaminase-like pyridoxal phosphate-dependent protein
MSWTLDQIDTPALLIDLDVVDANLRHIQDQAQGRGFHLWPHTKTHKSTWLAQQQVACGAQGITVAKLGEAEVMRAAGLTQMLIAYPLVGRLKARRLAELLGRGTTVRVALDSPEAADTASCAARDAGAEVGILLEVDTGFHRVGVAAGDAAVPLARYIAGLPGLRLLGLASFAGHINNATAEDNRRQILQAEAEALARTRDALAREGLTPEVISVGGTHHGARMPEIDVATEIRPGTYVYNDRNTLLAGSCTVDECAASVLVTVVSAHESRAVIDGGSKTFSSDPSPFGGYGLVKGHPDLVFERMSEEHGVLVWPPGTLPLRVGERLEVIPNHICPVVNLHDAAYGLRGGQVERVIVTDGRGRSR